MSRVEIEDKGPQHVTGLSRWVYEKYVTIKNGGSAGRVPGSRLSVAVLLLIAQCPTLDAIQYVATASIIIYQRRKKKDREHVLVCPTRHAGCGGIACSSGARDPPSTPVPSSQARRMGRSMEKF